MTIIEFAGALNGKPLSEYQKKLLEFMTSIPKDSKFVYGRNGKIYLVNEKENE